MHVFSSDLVLKDAGAWHVNHAQGIMPMQVNTHLMTCDFQDLPQGWSTHRADFNLFNLFFIAVLAPRLSHVLESITKQCSFDIQFAKNI